MTKREILWLVSLTLVLFSSAPTALAVNYTFSETQTIACHGLPSGWRSEGTWVNLFSGGGSESLFMVCSDNQTATANGLDSFRGTFTQWTITVKIFDINGVLVAQNSMQGHTLKAVNVTATTANGIESATASQQISRI
jgi:hypothetical protein